MAITFDKLLVPVDFSLNTEIAIQRAMVLIGAEKAVLHLLHIVRTGQSYAVRMAKKELEELAMGIEKEHPDLVIKTHVFKGRSVQRMIIEAARMLTPDLILIGRHTRHGSWSFSRHISPDNIARRTNCPVLTVKPGSRDGRTKVILIPIRNFLPERKLEWAILLARKYRAQVHLLAVRENKDEEGFPQVFLKAYHFLRAHLFHPVEFSSTTRQDMAKATINYAELIMADLILVNPGFESGAGGLIHPRHLSDLLHHDSKIQILDIEPYK